MVSFRQLWREAWQGKTIARILTNHVLEEWRGEVHGLVLDLACGNMPSYRRIMRLTENPHVRIVGVDYDLALRPTVVANLKLALPFKDSIADVVIISGFLHILPDPNALLAEVQRVFKRDGLLILTAPLIFPRNPEPTDYWRFTEEAVQLLLERASFVDISIVPVGGRWTAVAYLLYPFLVPRKLMSPFVYWLCLKLDAWTKRFRLSECPIGYVVKARAPA